MSPSGTKDTVVGTTRDLAAAREEAIEHHVMQSICGFVSTSFTGSGFFVRVGDDVLIATAGHVVETLAKLRAVKENVSLYVPMEGAKRGRVQVAHLENRFLERADGRRNPDVGYVVLSEEARSDARVVRPLDLNKLQRRPDIATLLTEPQFTAGFPYSLTEMAKPEFPSASLVFGSPVESPCPQGHPAAEEEGGPDPDYGYHLSWQMPEWVTKMKIEQEPGGMSGAPLWTVRRSDETGLWSPENHASVIGVLFFFDRPSCVRCEPIENWLRFVEEAGVPAWTDSIAAARRSYTAV